MFLEPISFCDFGAFFHVGDIAQLAFFFMYLWITVVVKEV